MDVSVLTKGGIEALNRGDILDKPVFQFIGFKTLPSKTAKSDTRYRVILSDGVHLSLTFMLSTQANQFIENKIVDTNTVIRLLKYNVTAVNNNKRINVILDLEVVHTAEEVGQRLGNPQKITDTNTDNTDKSAPPTNQNGQTNGGQNKPNGSSFYGNNAAPSRAVNNIPKQAPRTPGGSVQRIHSIESLSPYQNRWTIRVRVTAKSSIRTYSNSRGEGKLFNVTLVDETGEIRATMFKEIVDKFYDLLEVNQVYFISRGQLKQADKRYSSVNNDYEMTFNADTTVVLCEEDVDLPSIKFNFVPINKMETKEPNSILDIIGVVKITNDLSTVKSRQTQKEIMKRDLVIVDESECSIRLTLWGGEAENFNATDYPIMAVKGCRLSEWNGRSLSTLNSSQTVMNPDIPEAHRLRGWFDNVGINLNFDEYKSGQRDTQWTSLYSSKKNFVSEDKAEYFSVTGNVGAMKRDNCMYQACPAEGCNKKVIDQGNGSFRCEKCNQEYPNFKWRMILQVNISDYSSDQWITCFQESAEAILGVTAEDLGRIREENEEEFEEVFHRVMFSRRNFKLRSKFEMYNDERRRKVTCSEASPVDYASYAEKLMDYYDKESQS